MDKVEQMKDVAGNVVTLTIRFNPQSGETQIHGPLGDKVFCLGVLELAKQAVLSFKPGGMIESPIFVPPKNMKG